MQKVEVHPKVVERDGQKAVVVDLVNPGKKAVCAVVHPRYFGVEMLDGRKQFTRGKGAPPMAFPAASDYLMIEPKARAEAVVSLPLAVEAKGVCTIGSFRFEGLPASTEVRITYKAEAMMPNLPSKMQKSLARGPEDGRIATALEFPS